MNTTPDHTSLWEAMPPDVEHRLDDLLAAAASVQSPGGDRIVFFRADDVGVPGARFNRLVQLFCHHQVPLTLALVPAWLTQVRWQRLLELCGDTGGLWGWIQHGWRHRNHESRGRKQEFGPSRTQRQKRDDIRSGLQRLKAVTGESLLPIFTPPWNRCDQETLNALRDMGYKAISRSLGAQPSVPSALPDYPVSVDLHTRKDIDAEAGWQELLSEIRTCLADGFCGIMIHHQRMSDRAYDFLDLLLSSLKQWKQARLVHLGTLIEEGFLMRK